jgi:hypothetical protein
MENNKLIAEFMGEEYSDVSIYECSGRKDYDTSWDWLMPVVNKIEDYLADNVGKVGYFDECLNSNDLEVRHQAVVEFIKAYNYERQ